MNNWGRGREVEKVKPPIQVSVAQLPEDQQAAAMRECEIASERYPSVAVAGHLLHVFSEPSGGWSVWLNCEDADFTGVCVAADAPTRDAAIAEAVRVFEAVVEHLQGPTAATAPDAVPTGRDAYHAHLDACQQCRENPFNHCADGFALLTAAANSGDRP